MSRVGMRPRGNARAVLNASHLYVALRGGVCSVCASADVVQHELRTAMTQMSQGGETSPVPAVWDGM